MFLSKVLGISLASALVVAPITANAGFELFGTGFGSHYRHAHHFHHIHHMKTVVQAPPKAASNTSHSSGMSAGSAYIMAAGGCSVVSLMIGAAMKKKGELTRREAHQIVGDCFIPFVGGYLLTSMMTN